MITPVQWITKEWPHSNGEKIRFEEESGYIHIYGADKDRHDCFQVEHTQAVLNACDIAVSEDKHEVWVTVNGNYQIFIPNTSFLSMVLTQLTYTPKE